MDALCSFSALASCSLKAFSSGRVGRVLEADSAAGAAAGAVSAIVQVDWRRSVREQRRTELSRPGYLLHEGGRRGLGWIARMGERRVKGDDTVVEKLNGESLNWGGLKKILDHFC